MAEISNKLREKLKSIPNSIGIYKMMDLQGNIIYIGKSISLKNRVRSYFSDNPNWGKVEKMVKFIDDIEYKLTDTHLEARLEECRLIKEIKPIFNSQFKNDSSYVYLKIEDYNIYNSLSISHTKEYNCFGPFKSKKYLTKLIDSFKNLYPIIAYNNNYEFDYNLIPILMDENTFNENKKSLEEILSSDTNLISLIKSLERKMMEASSKLQFERASYFKNILDNLKPARNRLLNNRSTYSGNIFLRIPTQNGFKLFFIRNGQILLKENQTSLTDTMVKEFINKGRMMGLSKQADIQEKALMDFKDILFSEIRTLPDEMVVYLKN